MSNDNTVMEIQNIERVSLSPDYELKNWSERFNVSPVEVRDAVNQVGNLAHDVARYLRTGIGK